MKPTLKVGSYVSFHKVIKKNPFSAIQLLVFKHAADRVSYFGLQCAAESTHFSDSRIPPQKLYPVKSDTW